ncbi:P-loop containing nucleoside triphosphate hydrolase protein [Flagelloscypha sp. PMI_526]|nr:P-loop containing nucleoside triphosphate hydrolase protein [Flagelloscypha sp. PMI_526]
MFKPPGQSSSRIGAALSRTKKSVPNVSKVIAVSSCKGGVGKSTVAVNLAFSLALLPRPTPLRVGILDLDIFGPSLPTLLGLSSAPKPDTTEQGGIIPLVNHGMPSMSMGYLVNSDQPVVWRGLMVQKAVQQLLFDVDWSASGGDGKQPLDALVIDLPPGTGDVPLSLGQLVNVDASLVISTPQRVALADVGKGIAMLRKLDIPTTSLILNQSHISLPCPKCSHIHSHTPFGSAAPFENLAKEMAIPIGGYLPLLPDVSDSSDRGIPYMLSLNQNSQDTEWKDTMTNIATQVWDTVQSKEH